MKASLQNQPDLVDIGYSRAALNDRSARKYLPVARQPVTRQWDRRIAFAPLAVFVTCASAHAQSSAPDPNAAPPSRVVVPSTGSSSQSASSQPVPLSNAGAPVSSVAPNTALPPSEPAAAAGAPANPYANYQWKGIIVNLPPPPDTVTGNLFGYRQKLADDYGIGYIGVSDDVFFDNILRHDHHGTQEYIGQKPTSLSENNLLLTLDLSRYGIPDGQIVAGLSYASTSWNPAAPTSINLGTLTYYQTLFNKRVEVKVGLLSQVFEYLGLFTGGNLAGGLFGPSGQLFPETGATTSYFPTYGINITGHITKHVYDKFGIARGVTPLGNVEEHNFNPSSLRFSTPQSGAWVINEFGYIRPAEPDAPQTWVRAGSVFSAGHYSELDHPGLTSNANYFLYLCADRQVLQTSSRPGQAYRGLYAGFSAEYVPANLNFFSQYYEARVYGFGLLPHRPFDQASVVFSDQFFSSFLYGQLRLAHQLVHGDSKTITGSYSFHLFPGFYVNAALGYTDNPSPLTYTGSTGSALTVASGVAVFF